jgi:hypothetical protein
MPNRRQVNKPRRVNLVVEARAGLIPASDDMADEIRARTNLTARIIHTIKPYLGSVTRVSDDLAITNILSDLRHYCDCRGLAFKKLDRAAYALYSKEKAYEVAWPTPPGYLESVTYRQPIRAGGKAFRTK